jgi:uroporphyrinogen decarboxylase
MDYLLLKACRGEKTPYMPIWLMRQAGRYMKEYQDMRAKYDFMTLCKTPELAAQVTLQPIDRLGVDAAILFSDILVIPEAMGMDVQFPANGGPVIQRPIRDAATFGQLRLSDPEETLAFVFETIRILRKELDGRVPLIGFSGAPFTLATYMIEGGGSKNFTFTKSMAYQSPELFVSLMEMITEMVCRYLLEQIKAGAHVVQLFDTWAGILSPDDFSKWVLPYVKRIISTVKKTQTPVIYFVNNGCGLLDQIRSCGSDVIGVDWRMRLSDASNRLNRECVLQGNLDPCALFAPANLIESYIRPILEAGSMAKGHIFNLGHGILPQTPVDNVKALVEMVHRLSEQNK